MADKTINQEAFQQLLSQLRASFVEELPNRLDTLDNLLLAMEKSGAIDDSYHELFRHVHSLKGSGGTHGLHIITSICHQLEDILSANASTGTALTGDFIDACLAYVDLLRMAVEDIRQGKREFSGVEQRLNELRAKVFAKRRSILLVDNSKLSTAIYTQMLKQFPVRTVTMNDSHQALMRLLTEPFDLLITANELPLLSGSALIGAMRLSSSANRQMKAILITSNPEIVRHQKRHTDPDYIITKDAQLAVNLQEAVGKAMQ